MRILLFIFIIYPVVIFGQSNFSKEFSFSADNDLFISYINDQYYSSGLFFLIDICTKIKIQLR